MGTKIFDEYSFLHFATGAVAYYWGITAFWLFIVHSIFELLENTETGMKIINSFPIWPGGKSHPDNLINRVGDTISALIGWFIADRIFIYTGSARPIEMRAT
jgi:hypothetical protein